MAFPVKEETVYTEINGLTTDHDITLPLGAPPNSMYMVVFSSAAASNPVVDTDNSSDGWQTIRAVGENSPTLVIFWKLTGVGFEYLRIKTSEPVRSLAVAHGISNALKIGETVVTTSEYNNTPNAVPQGMDFTIPLTQAQKKAGQTVNIVSKDDTMWMVAGVWAGAAEVTAQPTGWTALKSVKKTVAQAVNEPRQLITTDKNGRTLIETPSKLTSTAGRWRTITLLIFPRVSTGQIVKKLEAVDTMEVLLGISEGPIKGPVGGSKGIYFNNTQVMANDGTLNFDEASIDFYPGNPMPPPLRLKLRGASNNIPVNVALGSNIPVTRPTRLTNIDYIDVRLTLDRLAGTGKKGPINNTITYRIEYKASSSNVWIKHLDKDIVITGLTMSKYPKDYRIVVPRINEVYDVRVTKITAENTVSKFADLTFESIQEVIAEARTYPNTAMLRADIRASDQFTGFPTIYGDYEGLIIRVPTNYNPTTRTYTGAWDGTWKMEYTNNPAFVLYDYVMNERYGMKSYYPEIILDKYDVYEAAQWCDQMVPDGQGGMQPRYTFNAYLSEGMKGKELAQYIAGTFNSTFFDDLNGTAFLRVDKDDQAVQLFTKENTIAGDFDYSYTDITSRFNDITVTFINPEVNWNQDRRRVKDDAAIERHGRIPHDFVAIGCNNAHEALRRAHYKLITQQTETRIVRFSTNRIGNYTQLFDVILISDPDMGWGVSGRIQSLDNGETTVLLRDPIFMEAGVSYTMSIPMNDLTMFTTELVGTYSGDVYTFEVADPLPLDRLPPQATFTLESVGSFGAPRPFRVLKIEETDGNVDAISIEAIAINRNKWYDADNVTNSGVIEYARLDSPFNVPSPEFVGFTEVFSREDSAFVLAVTPYFNRRAYSYFDLEGRFEVWSRLQGSDNAYEKRDLERDNTIKNHPPGVYEFKILGVSSVGSRTRLNEAQVWIFSITNPMEPPPDITWATIDEREIHWVYPEPPEDFLGFELRYHNVAGRVSWDDAVKPHSGVLSSTSFYTNLIPASARVILIKATDVFGVYSQNPAVIRIDENVAAVATNQVQKYEFHVDGGSNLIVAPRDLGNAVWMKENLSVTTNFEPGPSGEGFADLLSETTNGDYQLHRVSQTITTDPSEIVYMSVDIRPELRRYVEVHLDEPLSGSGIHARFDMVDGVPVYVQEIGDATFPHVEIVPLTDGWWRLIVEGIPNLAGGTEVVVSVLGVGVAATNDPDAPMYGRPAGKMYPRGTLELFYLSAVSTFETEYIGDPSAGYVVDLFSLLEDRPAWYGEKINCAIDPADGFLKANSVSSFYTGNANAPMYSDADALMYTEVFSFFDYITDLPVVHPGELIINADYMASGYSVSIRPVENPPAPWVPAGERPWVTPGTYEILTRVFGGATRGVLRELTVLVDAEDQQEMVVDVPISAVGDRLPISKTYSQIKVVSITILDDGGNAVNSKVLDYQTTIGAGPLVELRDNNNVLVSGRVTATIRGYV